MYKNNLLIQAFDFMLANDHSESAKEIIKLFLQNISAIEASRFYEFVTEYATIIREDSQPISKEDYIKSYIYADNDCWCNGVTYRIENDRVVITSSYRNSGYGMVTYGNIAIIPSNHPNKNYLTNVLIQIQRLQAKPYNPNEPRTWVYELQGIGKDPDNLKCRSCYGTDKDKAIALREFETLKFGIARHLNNFEQSVDFRYSSDKAAYGINEINHTSITRPTANVLAIRRVFSERTETQARLVEKILIFNYILADIQQKELRRRGIVTNYDLPHGNPIAR